MKKIVNNKNTIKYIGKKRYYVALAQEKISKIY